MARLKRASLYFKKILDSHPNLKNIQVELEKVAYEIIEIEKTIEDYQKINENKLSPLKKFSSQERYIWIGDTLK